MQYITEPVTRYRARHPRRRALCAALLIVTALAACGQQEPKKETSRDQGQTIARVNGQEITEHELESELKQLGEIEPEERSAMAREVLRRMVRRAVLAQKAEEANLHRTPEVMMDLRRQRAETLARAYLRNGIARQLPISKYDVEDYVDQHPHYFEERKHYVFDQVLIDNDLVTDEIRDALEGLTTLSEVESVLAERSVEFSRRLNSNLGSQFPREAVVKLDALEPGEIFLTETNDQVVISELVKSRLQPVSGEEARELAEHLLSAQRDAAASRRIIEELLANSNIEFLGSFSDTQVFPDEAVLEPIEDESADQDEEEEAALSESGAGEQGEREKRGGREEAAH